MHATALPGDYDLTGIENQALDQWDQYRRHHPRSERELTRGPDWSPHLQAIHAVSYAACLGLAAQALGTADHDEAARNIAPLLDAETQRLRQRGGVRSRWHTADPRLTGFLRRVRP